MLLLLLLLIDRWFLRRSEGLFGSRWSQLGSIERERSRATMASDHDEWDDEEDEFIPLEPHGRPRDQNIVVSLAGAARHPAVIKMLEYATKDFDKLLFLVGDAMHVVVQTLLAQGDVRNLPNIESASDWYEVTRFVHWYGSYPGQRWTEIEAKKQVHAIWWNIISDAFIEHDMTFHVGMHTNQLEMIANLEATTGGNFNKLKIVKAHVKMYLKAKYPGLWYGGAPQIADLIVSDDPLSFREIKSAEARKRFTNDELRLIVATEAGIYQSFLGLDPQCPYAILEYRFFMLSQIDLAANRYDESVQNVSSPPRKRRRNQKKKSSATPIEELHNPKRFGLTPIHACGGSHYAYITGMYMTRLINCIRSDPDEHIRSYYDHVIEARNVVQTANQVEGEGRLPQFPDAKLSFHFEFDQNITKKLHKWKLGRMFKTNGIELHVSFEQNKAYMANGRPKTVPRCDRDTPKVWDLPKLPRRFPRNVTEVCGADPGHHHLFTCARYTGRYGQDGQPEIETRVVKKTWYDHISGRGAVRRKSERISKSVQSQGLLQAVTNNTLKTANFEAFMSGIAARRDSYESLYSKYTNKKKKRLKFAMRARRDRAIDTIIDYITWGGTVVAAIGDGGKHTGIRGCTPGGPIKFIKRRMNKRGYSAFEVPEGKTSESSVCCHGAKNKNQRNGQSPDTYKIKTIKWKTLREGEEVKPIHYPTHVHGICICQKCKRTWNRDAVGSINILDIAIDVLDDLPRAVRFTKNGNQFYNESQGGVVRNSGIIPHLTPGPALC